jgi:hypothetical protein
MGEPLKVKFRIGEIEFEAEGSPEDVEKQRVAFMDTLLPAAINAMIQTQGYANNQNIKRSDVKALPQGNIETKDENENYEIEISKLSINEFLKKKQFSSQIDSALGLIYYHEKVKKCMDFSTDELKQYFRDAKIPIPRNPSDVVLKLITPKSCIMISDDKNRYKLTRTGEEFIENYSPKPKRENRTTNRPNKTQARNSSVYNSLNADDLSLKKYPEVQEQRRFKDQMMLSLYIVYNEGHGDTFSVADVQYIMTSILGLPASKDQVQGVFTRNVKWFDISTDNDNKKVIRHRLLIGAKDYAKTIIGEDKK